MGSEGLSLTFLDVSEGFLKAVLSLLELRQNGSVILGAASCQRSPPGWFTAAVSPLLPAALGVVSWQQQKGLDRELPHPLPDNAGRGQGRAGGKHPRFSAVAS